MILPALLLPAAAALTACGGSSDSPSGTQEAATSLTYSYPIHQQTEVPTPAPVVLHFSDSVEELGVENSIVLRSNGEEVTTEARYADKGRSLILTPTEKLRYHSDYVVDFADDFPVNVSDITFSTKAAEEGLRADVISDENMELARILPSGGESDPMMDFSTLRFQFTQPIDRQTVSYGIGGDDTVVLMNENEEPVPAWVVVDGPHLTIDPKEDLTAGHNYRIRFKAGAQRGPVASIYGEAFSFIDGSRYAVRPASSLAEGVEPDERPLPLVQYITTPDSEVDGEVAEEQGEEGKSPLTGKPVNEIPVNAVLLGDEDTEYMAATQQEGTVLGDLAFLPDWPRVSPLRIRRGTLLTGDNIDVKIGGQVEAGFDSGEVRVHFLSDATGYLIPNIYDENGPRLVRLYMDVAMSTEDPIANGGVTQDITHLELVGTVTTDTNEGVIDINAVGVVEPMILGQERGYGMLSFQLQTDRDQTEELVEQTRQGQKDTTPPKLQSWTLGGQTDGVLDKADLYTPGEPIVLNYDEPLDRESVRGKVVLYHNGQPMDIVYHVDGAALVVKIAKIKERMEDDSLAIYAEASTTYSPENAPNEYRLQLANGITDLAGNQVQSTFDEQFELPVKIENRYEEVAPSGGSKTDFVNSDYAAMILSAYPGFPCVLSDDGRDLENDLAGRCAGGFPGIGVGLSPEFLEPGTELDNKEKDDVLPIMSLPANRPIIVQFSKEMDVSSIVLGRTFIVERINEQGGVIETVSGVLELFPKKVIFTPDNPWDWKNDSLYRYTIRSSGFEIENVTSASLPKIVASENYTCGDDSVCDEVGLPLQTQPLGMTSIEYNGETGEQRDYAVRVTAADYNAGGPDFNQFFRAGEKTNSVLQVLSTQPISDVNANFFHEQANLGTSVGTSSVGEYTFDVEEYGPTNILDSRYPNFDPSGVEPSPNSAKLLSRFDSQSASFGNVKGVNFGCAYMSFTSIPMECPQHKFTYLKSGMVAEVTDEVTEEGIKVKIWPSQVVSTSMDLYGLAEFPGGLLIPVPGFTGAQFLRMRFEESEDDPGVRNRPIVGWITEDAGEPVLNVDLDLYVDTPQVTQTAVGSATNTVNMRSYPIRMKLTGKVGFMDDGRMFVEQENIDPVNILLRLHNSSDGTGAGYADMFIPEHGSRLRFISESIK